MRLFSRKDLHDYIFLTKKYNEIVDVLENQIKAKSHEELIDDIEQKFALTQLKVAKELMDELGIEVSSDKARELGFRVGI
jgi:ribosome assembly protein YihI (activator of Der GTPase)